MFPIPPTVSPLTAAEVLTVRIALPRPRAIWQGELWPAPPVITPRPLPHLQILLFLLLFCPVVHAGRARTVGISWSTISPLRAAGLHTCTITLWWQPVREGELLPTPAVHTHTPNNKLYSLGYSTPVILLSVFYPSLLPVLIYLCPYL